MQGRDACLKYGLRSIYGRSHMNEKIGNKTQHAKFAEHFHRDDMAKGMNNPIGCRRTKSERSVKPSLRAYSNKSELISSLKLVPHLMRSDRRTAHQSRTDR